MNRNLLFLSAAFFLAAQLSSQTKISGQVLDKLSGDPLIGANVSIKGGFDGATTDSTGHFRFSTDETGAQILLASYIGFKPLEIPVDLAHAAKPLIIKLEEKPTDIREVVISAGSFEASDEKKGTVLLPLDIVTIPGANGDITGALNTLPGTTVNGETGQLIVRGGAANETRVYIDGLAVRNFYTSQMPDVPARSRFSPFQFKGTTFASGGYSAEYGQAMSSALILNTPDMPAQGGFNIGLSVLGPSLGRTWLKPKSAFSAAIGYVNLGPIVRLVKQNLSFLTPPESGFAGFEGRLKLKHDGLVKYGAQGSLGHSRIGFPKLDWETEGFSMGLENQNARAFATWRQPVGEQWTVYSAVQSEVNHDKYSPSTFPKFEVENWASSARFSASYSPNARLRWKNGVDANFFKIKYSQAPNPQKHDVAALFSEVETYLGDRFIVRAGLRGEQDFQLEKTVLAPRLSAAFKTGKDAQVSASWGIFYQSPVDTLLARYANLGFEKAEHYILNYQFARDQRIFRVETFYKKYSQLIRTTDALGNTGDGYAQGIELFFRDRKTLKWGDYWISYSYLDTKRQYLNYPVAAQPTFAATHNASLVFKYFFAKPKLATNFSYTVQSGRPYFNPENPVFLGDRTPVYQNFSAQVTKLTSLWGNFTVLVFSVSNVFGIKQVYQYRFASIPNSNPTAYARQEILPPAPRFFFLGCFINIGDKRKEVSKNEALE